MKYDIFNPETKRVLGWAQTVDAAEKRAQFFMDTCPKLQIRITSTKRIVKELKKQDAKTTQ